MSGTEHLLTEVVGHTLVVTMNRPEAKNALSPAMIVGLADAWVRLNEDDDIRCAILTGSGGSFCTGMDLKARANDDSGPNPYQERWAADPDLHWKALLRHYRIRKPLIAAVEGYAVAGGTEILQATHLRVAGESATFGVFESKAWTFPSRWKHRSIATSDRVHKCSRNVADGTGIHRGRGERDRSHRTCGARWSGFDEVAGISRDDLCEWAARNRGNSEVGPRNSSDARGRGPQA